MGETQEQQAREALKAQLLGNPAVLRLVRGFETYENVLNSADSDDDKREVVTRMREVYTPKEIIDGMDDNIKKNITESNNFLVGVLSKIDGGEKLTTDGMVDYMSNYPNFCHMMLSHHGSKPDRSEVRRKEMYVNDVISVAREDKETLGISLRAAPVADFKQLLGKVKEGLVELANFLSGENFGVDFSGVRNIRMVSWLLGPGFSDKIKSFLGNCELRLKELPNDLNEVAESQKLALFYNQPSLKRYLETGEKPIVRELVFSKKEFIKKFGSTSQ